MPESRIPRIQEVAPNFEAHSTHGLIRLSDYTDKGKWVLLFSHPTDFSPVCSTEFIEFARHSVQWGRLGVQLIAVSTDSVPAHIAWIRDLERLAGVKIDFPLVADLNQRVSYLYGLLHEAASDTAPIRATFFIDPKGIIRALLCYPTQLGRNIDELLRVVEALQFADANTVSCPANWHPGDPTVVPSPTTLAEAEKLLATHARGLHTSTWYLTTKDTPTR